MDYKLTCVEARIVDPQIDKVLAQFGLSPEKYENMQVPELAQLEVE